ncbi:MAG: hypothetical protein ABSH13_20485 [Candidatus Acidiferrum sp.]|jgi:hypothetical protein
MPCEKYQAALIDLAANGAEPVGDLRGHLDECTSCRSYMERQQFLFAAIDSGVQASANAALPTLLLQRFEARIAQEAPAKGAASPRWWMYAAAVAAAVIVLTLPILRPRNARERVALFDAPQYAAKQSVTGETARAIALDAAHVNARKSQQFPKRTARPEANVEPEVLVPPDERVAFERFLSDLSGKQNLAAALVKPMVERHERPDALIETPEIEISALTVPPLIVRPLEESNDR